MESDNALLNSCVLQHLFELVDIETLKMCRYVCKTWNFVAGIQLRKTTWVCLELVEELQDFASTFNTPSDPSMRMMRNFQLRINDFTVILGVLLQHRSSILSLDLYNFDSYLADTLLSLPSLEHMTIRSISRPSIPDWNRNPFGGIPFPKLKSCSLVYGFSNEGRQRSPVSTSMLMDFYIDLLRSSEKTLERLQLSRFDYSDLREIFQKVNLQGISDLVLQEVSSISQNSAGRTATELKLFKKLVRVQCCNITRLKCWVPPASTNEEQIQDFYSIILESCEKNLKTLHLSWNPSANYDYLFIKVNFPVLTELVIDCFESPEDSQPVLQKLKTFLVKCRTLRRFQCWMPKDDTGQNVAFILESLPNAEEVDLLAKSLDDESKVSQGFATLPKIRRLTLEQNFGVPLDELASRLPNIQELSIFLAENGSRGWARMEKLKVLNINSRNDRIFDFHRHYNITDINFPNLTELSITLSAGSGATVFSTLRNLKCLYLEEGSSLCDEDITGIESERLLTLEDDPEDVVRNRPYIGDLKCLQVLRLEGPATTAASLKYGISNVDSLTHLTIQTPAVRVTKIVREESIGIRKYFHNSDTRGFGSSVREVRLRRLKDDISALNIESLMPPKLPRLVEMIFLITPLQAIDPLQVDAMIASRHRNFRFSQTSLNSSPINRYTKKFVFEKIKAA